MDYKALIIIVIAALLLTILIIVAVNMNRYERLKEGYFVEMLTSDALAKIMPEFKLTDGCSAQGTCAAFTFLNNKTAPIVFLTKDFNPTGCGIIFDSSLWRLITNFSVVDGATFSRITCSTDDGSFTYGKVNNYPINCGADDLDCRILNSGGSPSIHSKPCFDSEKYNADTKVWDVGTCDNTCLKPQLCEGSQQDLLTSYGNLITDQCKYGTWQYDQWMRDLHQLYKLVLDGAFSSKGISYSENEFNIYINPDTTSAEYQRQNEIFKNAVVGVLYVTQSWTDLGGATTDPWAASYSPATSAAALANFLSKQLGREVPLYRAAVLDAHAFLGNNYKTPAVVTALNRALNGSYRWKDIFTKQ